MNIDMLQSAKRDNYATLMLTTAAPVPVYKGEVISVIHEELFACFSIGYSYALTIIESCKGPVSVDLLDFGDISYAEWERNEKIAMTAPHTIDTLSAAAFDSVKSWASDVNAFYNSDLLKKMVYDLCDDWFQIGTMARADTYASFVHDLDDAITEARKAVSHVQR